MSLTGVARCATLVSGVVRRMLFILRINGHMLIRKNAFIAANVMKAVPMKLSAYMKRQSR
jgi:hypothetical protein